MNLLIGIPAFNEETVIVSVVRSIPKKIPGIQKIDILVIDDGSTDSTEKIATSAGARVLSHVINRGLGGALKSAFLYAKKQQYDLLITMDADGQHNPKDIDRLISPILNKQADVVIGTRWKESAHVPLSRIIINKFANIITYIFFGVYTTDSQSGYRAFNKKAIDSISLKSEGMEVSSEFFKEIYTKKLRFLEIPIKAIYTDYSQAKGQKLTNSISVLFQLFIRFIKQ